MRITSIVSGTVHAAGVWQSYYTNTLLPDLAPSLILSKHYHELYVCYNESTICSPFLSQLITLNVSSVLIVFC